MTEINLDINGIQEAQDANLRAIAELSPAGEFGAAIRDATIALHRYAVSITHVGRYIQTSSGKWRWARPDEAGVGGGALRASHRMEVTALRGRVYVDPGSVNPRTGRKPAEYGAYENARGGAHAFYDRATAEYGPEVLRTVGDRVSAAVVK
jgi:hypothetical protein